jgi:hypothetical protein
MSFFSPSLLLFLYPLPTINIIPINLLFHSFFFPFCLIVSYVILSPSSGSFFLFLLASSLILFRSIYYFLYSPSGSFCSFVIFFFGIFLHPEFLASPTTLMLFNFFFFLLSSSSACSSSPLYTPFPLFNALSFIFPPGQALSRMLSFPSVPVFWSV